MGTSLLRRAGLVMIAVTVAARGFGYIREAIVAQAFGASREVDLFLAALTIPTIVVTAVYYAIPNAFVPLWTQKPKAHRHTIRMAVVITILSVMLALSIHLLAAPLTRLLASGFEPSLQSRVASLLRIGAFAIVFAVLEALLRSRLLARKQFGLPGLSYVWQGIGVIVGVLGWREHGSVAMTWGLVMGTAGAVIWNLGLTIRSGFQQHEQATDEGAFPAGGSVWVWVALVLLTDSISQLYSVVDRHYGSFLEIGSISALNYASLIAGLPIAIVGLALSTAILPFLSDAAEAQDHVRSASIIDRAVRWTLLFVVPIALWMIVFRAEFVTVLLERGAFNATARDMTSTALAATAFGIVPLALATIWSRSFYASRRWLPLASAALCALLAKFVLSAIFSRSLGLAGLALATSCAWTFGAVIVGRVQWSVLRPAVPGWISLFVKVVILVGPAAVLSSVILGTLGSNEAFLRATVAGSGAVVGMISLVMIGRRWGISQVSDLRGFFRSTWR